MYFKNKRLNRKAEKNFGEINDIKDFLFQNKLTIIKLNHSVDTNIQRFTQYEGYFQLSMDFEELEIINKKPTDQPFHILQMDPQELVVEKRKFFTKRLAQIRRQNSGFIKGDPKDVLTPDEAAELGFEHDVQLEFQINVMKEIELVKSQSSCQVSEIEGFIYGPF